MPINVPLLRKTLEHISTDPARWDQACWARRSDCATTCCLAGHALILAGGTLDFEGHSDLQVDEHTETGHGYGRDGRHGLIEYLAQAELGLDTDQAARLFHGENTLPELWALAGELTGGEITTPPDLPNIEQYDYLPAGDA
jgi:hypothetical protein